MADTDSKSQTGQNKLQFENDYHTPEKISFSHLSPETRCFSCGVEKCAKNMRMIKNVALKTTYTSLIKECFLVELPKSVSHRICSSCIVKMQKTVVWRREAVARLERLSQNKRSRDDECTPQSLSFHSYSRPQSDARPTLTESPKQPQCDTQQTPAKTSIQPQSPTQTSIQMHTYSRTSVKQLASEARTVRRKLVDDFEVELSQEKSLDEQLSLMNSQIQLLCSESDEGSVLGMKVDDERLTDIVELAVVEMSKRVPLLFRVLAVASGTSEHKELFLGVIYAMIMRQRSQRLNAFQKMLTATCLRYHANNQLLEVLFSLNLTMSEGSKLHFLSSLADVANNNLIQELHTGKNCKVTVDNIDGRMFANQVRVGSGNKDFHFTHWTVLPDRFHPHELAHLDDTKPDQTVSPNGELFYCTQQENEDLRYAYKLEVARILCEEVELLKPLAKAVPKVLQHTWTDVVSRKSSVYSQPIILEDSKYLPNCVRILDKITQDLDGMFTRAGRGQEFKSGSIKVTLGGDQLTRCHLDSAKILRWGSHTPSETFSQLFPIVEECFHVQQDLLEKIYKRFYNTAVARSQGTLNQLRAELHRTNVNGNVKAGGGYEAHKDFAVLVARMLIVEKFCSEGAVPNLPEHIKLWPNAKKLQWLMDAVTPLVEDIYEPFTAPSQQKIRMVVQLGQTVHQLVFPPSFAGKQHNIVCGNLVYSIRIPGPAQQVKHDDELYNYSSSFLRTMMDFIVFDKIIHAADIDRLAPILKRLIPLFVGLTSYRSKYAIEAVNFLTKTEHSLSERESTKVKLRAFVNLSGKVGENKSADMQQEINIKKVKNILKGLGAGKTDKAMVRSSQAAPAVDGLAEALRASLKLRPSSSMHDHHKKDDTEDKAVVAEVLAAAKPFEIRQGRTINYAVDSSVFNSVDKFKLNEFIVRNARRATNQCVPDMLEDGDVEEHDD